MIQYVVNGVLNTNVYRLRTMFSISLRKNLTSVELDQNLKDVKLNTILILMGVLENVDSKMIGFKSTSYFKKIFPVNAIYRNVVTNLLKNHVCICEHSYRW